jgi:hypothetical protein
VERWYIVGVHGGANHSQPKAGNREKEEEDKIRVPLRACLSDLRTSHEACLLQVHSISQQYHQAFKTWASGDIQEPNQCTEEFGSCLHIGVKAAGLWCLCYIVGLSDQQWCE